MAYLENKEITDLKTDKAQLIAVGTLTSLLHNSAKVYESLWQMPFFLRKVGESEKMSKFVAASMLAAVLSTGMISKSWAAKCIGSTGQWNDGSGSCSTCGANCDWEINGGTLKITGSGTMKGYDKAADQPWSSQKDNITAVSVSGVDNVGYRAFQYLDKVTSTTLSDSVKEVEHRAFWGTALTSANLNKVETLGEFVFYDASIQSVDIPNVTSIGDYAFSGATSLQSVDMPKVTSIGYYAFSGATSLQSVDMPKVTSIRDYAFSGATSLSYAGFDPEMVTSIGYYSFYNAGVSGCSRTRAGCGSCSGSKYIASGRGCVTSAQCSASANHYFVTENGVGSCLRIPITTAECSTTDYYYNNGAKCVKRESPTSPMTCATGYHSEDSLCVANPPNCNTFADNTCTQCATGYLSKEGGCVEPEACTGEYIVDSDNGLCKKMPGCLNYADGACSCDKGYYKKDGGCVSESAGCGNGYLGKDGECISSANGCGAGYKDMGGYCNRVRYTPAEAAAILNDDDNFVILTFKK